MLLVAATAVWWGAGDRARRGTYLRAVLVAAGICLALFALQWLLTTLILHHPLRARPMNAIWATVLIAEDSYYGFPAWPALVAFAVALPTYRLFRLFGQVALTLATLLAVALVFVGVNYPTDALTGAFAGFTIGSLALSSTHGAVARQQWVQTRVAVGAVALWAGMLGISLEPASIVGDTVPTGQTAHQGLRVNPPASVLTAMQQVAGTPMTLDAASNGHLLVAAVCVVVDADTSISTVQDTTRRTVNTAFIHWPDLDVLTMRVAARAARNRGSKVGTLYTATVSREDWPPGGFANGQPLPGKKYFHPRYYAPHAAAASPR